MIRKKRLPLYVINKKRFIMKNAIVFLGIILSMHIVVGQNWREIKTAGEFSLAIKEDGTLWSWGFNGNGQLGILTGNPYEYSPVQVGMENDWKTIAAGGYHAIAIKNDGTLWGWGLNGNGQVKGKQTKNFFAPEQINSDTDWVAVEACFASSFAIKIDGTLWAWGFNGDGALGIEGVREQTEPMQVGVAKWKSISSGGVFTMGIQEDHTMWHWGLHLSYAEDTGYVLVRNSVPVQFGTDSDWVSISVGMDHALAIKKDSSLWVHGDNMNSQLGYDDTVFANGFFQIMPDEKWILIESGSVYSFAVNENKVLYSWGNNIYGQLGIPEKDYVDTPTPIANHSVSQVSAAKGIIDSGRVYGLHTLMLNENKDIMCVAGANYVGQLGTGITSFNRTSSFICGQTAIADNDRTEHISVYPNPARNCFFVTNIQHANIVLYDMLGRKISSQYGREDEAVFYTENISPGLYILKIQKGNEVISRKIQVTR
jgi:alpha-tubulin suppressor-like RCC1 family protein